MMRAGALLARATQQAARKYTPRTCAKCGAHYHRRNLFEAWTSQNPGSRTGWQKVVLKVCTKCQGAPGATRALIVVEASLRRRA